MFSYARICVEVDLEKRLLEAIKLKIDDWTHIQKVDCDKLSFNCNTCHEYGHFTRNCTKNNLEKEVVEVELANEWQQV